MQREGDTETHKGGHRNAQGGTQKRTGGDTETHRGGHRNAQVWLTDWLTHRLTERWSYRSGAHLKKDTSMVSIIPYLDTWLNSNLRGACHPGICLDIFDILGKVYFWILWPILQTNYINDAYSPTCFCCYENSIIVSYFFYEHEHTNTDYRWYI